MKLCILTFLMLISISAECQKSKPLEIDRVRSYSIKDEGLIIASTDFGTLTVQADLSMPTKEDLTVSTYKIRFPKAQLNGDTLTIIVLEVNEAYVHNYVIEIVNNQYRITYDFISSGEEVEHAIEPENFRLILNSKIFKKGQEIKGYTEYQGTCTKGCWPAHSKFDIKGNFKVTIK